MRTLLAGVASEKLEQLVDEDCAWSWIYELPFVMHISLGALTFMGGEWLEKIKAAPDPQQAVLDSIPSDWDEDFRVEPSLAFAVAISTMRTMESIFTHGRSLSALVADAREDGNLESLWQALRIDRTILYCPSVMALIVKAELQDDRRFFLRLRAALKGLSQKHWAGLAEMKFSFFTLKDMGIEELSDADLEELMVHTLEVYQDVSGARKNLRAHYQRFRKFNTI